MKSPLFHVLGQIFSKVFSLYFRSGQGKIIILHQKKIVDNFHSTILIRLIRTRRFSFESCGCGSIDLRMKIEPTQKIFIPKASLHRLLHDYSAQSYSSSKKFDYFIYLPRYYSIYVPRFYLF